MPDTAHPAPRRFDNALHIMEVQGGSFVKALAHCYYMADSSNKAKLRPTMPAPRMQTSKGVEECVMG